MLRRSPRALGLWAGAVALAVVTGTIVAGDLATLHRRARSLGPERAAVVARDDLALGATLTLNDVGTRRVHASQLPPGVLRRRDDVVGRVVRIAVVRGGFVAVRNLAPAHRGLAGALPEGTRAVRLVIDDGLRPAPGSSVDVYATPASATDVLGTGRTATVGSSATLVAAGALVIATDDGAATSGATAGDRVGVTLLVEQDQAAVLAAASARGPLFLALVPPEDANPGRR